jgi:hypothetical protein
MLSGSQPTGLQAVATTLVTAVAERLCWAALTQGATRSLPAGACPGASSGPGLQRRGATSQYRLHTWPTGPIASLCGGWSPGTPWLISATTAVMGGNPSQGPASGLAVASSWQCWQCRQLRQQAAAIRFGPGPRLEAHLAALVLQIAEAVGQRQGDKIRELAKPKLRHPVYPN